MPTEIFNQLKVLRDGIAESLKKDPRYLTLHALDKSIAEIGGVLSASGLMTSDAAVAPPPFSVEPGTIVPVSNHGGPSTGANGHPRTASDTTMTGSSGLGGDPHSEALGKPIGTTASKSAKPIKADEGESDEEPEPAEALSEPEAAASVEIDERATLASAEPIVATAGNEELTAHLPAVPEKADGEEHTAADQQLPHVEHVTDHQNLEEAHSTEVEHADLPFAEPTVAQAPASVPLSASVPFIEGETLEDAATGSADGHGSHAAFSAAEAPAIDSFGGWASGYRLMAPKPGAALYQPSIAVKFGRLPGKVDLRPILTPIEDQGEIRSCVASAVASAYEAWIRKAHKQEEPVSRLFIYYNARWRDGMQEEDEGSAIQLAMESLCKFGACSEAIWPSDPHLALKKPGASAYEAAAPYRIADMARVPLKLEAWRQALAEGRPIVFGCELFESFDDCSRRGGVVPMPEPGAIAHAGHSGHAMCAVGYSDSEKVFIVRNSWSAEWGDGGYCYMPYAYLLSPTFNDGDCWIFVPKIPTQPPREMWSDATSPLTNAGKGVDFAIEDHELADDEPIGVDLFAGARHPFNGTIPADYATYVTAVSQGRWSELESFDVATYLAVAAALTDDDLFGDDLAPRGEPDTLPATVGPSGA